ncbi:MAG: hypothetical protein JO270_05400, partial [Acidobacteriaceae bacterium]|nr:hypothetical protein [Acidobacteriaceae bacterium]
HVFGEYGEPALPFCLFHFTMEDNQGYFTWVAEPVVEEGRQFLKYHREDAPATRLDQRVLDLIVASVDAYYDTLYKSAVRA